jgi:hypothetical protein
VIPDYGSGGWGFEPLAARTITAAQRPCARVAGTGRIARTATKLRPRRRPVPRRLRPPATSLASPWVVPPGLPQVGGRSLASGGCGAAHQARWSPRRIPRRALLTRRPGAVAPSSTAVLDKPSASRHPHGHTRRRCADPLRPATSYMGNIPEPKFDVQGKAGRAEPVCRYTRSVGSFTSHSSTRHGYSPPPPGGQAVTSSRSVPASALSSSTREM